MSKISRLNRPNNTSKHNPISRPTLHGSSRTGFTALASDREYKVKVHEIVGVALNAKGEEVPTKYFHFQSHSPTFDVPVRGRGKFYRRHGAGGLHGRIAFHAAA